MSDEALPPPPERPLQPVPSDPPSFWKMFFIGIGLFILSVILAPLLVVTIPTAIILLFFRDARALATGYLAGLGIAVLVLVVVCGSMGPLDFK